MIYPLTRDIQITFDQGDADGRGTPCKLAPPADKVFTDVIVSVP